MINRGNLLATIGLPKKTFNLTKGVYYSSELGLISLSSDGEERVTLADKNLGATQVWDGPDDGYSQLTCGNRYQWGNNYGFPYTGATITSITKVDASNYGSYYYSDTFIIPSQYWNDWTNPSNSNLWGGVTGTNESKRGPCPEGYHIPSKDENSALVSAMQNLGYIGSGDDYKKYLFMPYAGVRDSYNQGEPDGVNTLGMYWSVNSTSNSYEAHAFYISDSTVDPTGQWTKKTSGCCIRPFKNNVLVPDDTWRVLHQGSGSAGIFWNKNEGVISLSSDGINRISIADKNLGATAVYSYGYELTESNCGKYFQRGNNYGFPFSGELNISSTQVNATNYGPYYYSDVRINVPQDDPYTYNGDWSSSQNNNLWGYKVGTNMAMMGPCNEGYHIPSQSDYSNMLNIRLDINGLSPDDWYEGMDLAITLKIPFDGNGTYGHYWSSTPLVPYHEAVLFRINMYRYCDVYHQVRCNGGFIRPFKNEPVVPDNTREKLL